MTGPNSELSAAVIGVKLRAYCNRNKISIRELGRRIGVAPSTIVSLATGARRPSTVTLERLNGLRALEDVSGPGLGRKERPVGSYSPGIEQRALRDALAEDFASLHGHWLYLDEQDASLAQVMGVSPCMRAVREGSPTREIAEKALQALEEQRRMIGAEQVLEVLLLGAGDGRPEVELVSALAGFGWTRQALVLVDGSLVMMRRAETRIAGIWQEGMTVVSRPANLLNLAGLDLAPRRVRLVMLLGSTLGDLRLDLPMWQWLGELPVGTVVAAEVMVHGLQPVLAKQATEDDLRAKLVEGVLSRCLAPSAAQQLTVTMDAMPPAWCPVSGSSGLICRAQLIAAGSVEKEFAVPASRRYDLTQLLDLLEHLCRMRQRAVLDNAFDARRKYLVLQRF